MTKNNLEDELNWMCEIANRYEREERPAPRPPLGGGHDECLTDEEADLADAVRACEIAKAEFEAARLKLAEAEARWRELAGIEEEEESAK